MSSKDSEGKLVANDRKVSVIMGIYNCADTLPEAIESILSQTYDNWELILCDDASTDNTFPVAKSYQERFPEKIILIQNEKNSKLSYSLNHCLKYATGEYIARMDGDDKCLPERFEKQVQFLNDHPEYDLVGTAMQRFDENGLADILYARENPDYYSLRKGNPFYHATIMAHRYMYDKLNGYTVSDRTQRGQDYDLWFRFYHAGFSGNNINEPLYLVRENADAIKRRTAKGRLRAYRTMVYGYKLLGYPKRWLIFPFFRMCVKAVTPYKVMEIYRNWQKERFEKGQA